MENIGKTDKINGAAAKMRHGEFVYHQVITSIYVNYDMKRHGLNCCDKVFL